jgi:hypothetical protein
VTYVAHVESVANILNFFGEMRNAYNILVGKPGRENTQKT